MKSKSLIAAVSLQRKPEAKRVSDGDVIVAGIWLALYLLMIVGALCEPKRISLRRAVVTFRRRPWRMGRAWLAQEEESRSHYEISETVHIRIAEKPRANFVVAICGMRLVETDLC